MLTSRKRETHKKGNPKTSLLLISRQRETHDGGGVMMMSDDPELLPR